MGDEVVGGVLLPAAGPHFCVYEIKLLSSSFQSSKAGVS